METDDIVYLSLLLISIGLGYVFRKINDKSLKKWSATCIGLILVIIVSGKHACHPLLCTLMNALIIKYASRRYCHLASFIVQFSYLFFFRTTEYFGIPYPPAHTNLVQMMLTLKLVGLAFDVHDSYTNQKKLSENKDCTDEEKRAARINPEFLDIFHYAFCYVGVLTGPYYRYQTFVDWLDTPFSLYAPCYRATVDKIKYVPLYAGLFLLVSYLCPLSYTGKREFYVERSVLFRIWYITPMFFLFRTRLYTGLVLSECVCTMAGLGAYPVSTEPKAGQGPSKCFEELNQIAGSDQKAKEADYNFETIHNIDPYGSETVTTVRSVMKCWNSCIQYWLAMCVYKRFPSKKLRTVITMFVSAYWHGVYAGYYFCICSAPLYFPIEDLYVKLFLKDSKGMVHTMWEWIIWFFKMQTLSYCCVAFLMLHIDKIFFYWKSIYFVGHILAVIFYIVGIFIAKSRRRKTRVE